MEREDGEGVETKRSQWKFDILSWPWKSWISWCALLSLSLYFACQCFPEFSEFYAHGVYLIFRALMVLLFVSWLICLVAKNSRAVSVRNYSAVTVIAMCIAYLANDSVRTANGLNDPAKSQTEAALKNLSDKELEDLLKKPILEEQASNAAKMTKLAKSKNRGNKNFSFGMSGHLQTSWQNGSLKYRLTLDSTLPKYEHITLDLLDENGFPLKKHSFRYQGSQLYTASFPFDQASYEKISDWNLEQGLNGDFP